jgi:hypothetical protein
METTVPSPAQAPDCVGQHGMGPWSLAAKAATLQAANVSMYLHLLRSVLDDWVDEFDGPALVDYAVTCRKVMLSPAPPSGDAAHVALAAEIAYDRALVKLCTTRGVAVDVMAFSHPAQARARLERELAVLGISLSTPDRVSERLRPAAPPHRPTAT